MEVGFTKNHCNETVIVFVDRNAGRNKDFGQIFEGLYISTFQGGASFVDHLCYFCLVFAMFSCASVY